MEKSIQVLIEGGKATAAPPLGPALGPLGVNIGQVVAEINKKTKEFEGMKVPVKVIVNTDTKEFNIEVGLPPTSALLKKEAGIDKAAGNVKEKVADLSFDKIVKIAKLKADDLTGNSLKNKVKQVLGTCHSMGIFVDDKRARDVIKEVDEGKYDEIIK